MSEDWQSTALHPLASATVGSSSRPTAEPSPRFAVIRTIPPRRGIHLQQGVTAGPLPEQSHPAYLPMRRRPDGSYEEIDWDTAISEVAAGFQTHQ